MVQTNQSSNDSMLGRLVVKKGLATTEQVQRCLDQLSRADPDEAANQQSLSALLVADGFVTRSQIERLQPDIEEQKAGRQIPGYQLLKKLGAGAMATVYKSRQLSLDRLVAIKVLPRRYTNNPDFVSRFYAEGRAAAKLNHPHIVGALDVGQARDTHYFVMEYVEGWTVFDDITKKDRYKESKALDIAVKVARAMAHAHEAGFIHRDIKPKNIMITEDGNVKLADMGLARAVSDREAAEAEEGKAYGTPYYISPEQIRGEIDVDFRADIYSFGATVYHMVTGRVPFEGLNPSAVMHQHLKAEVKPPDHINPALSHGISEIIEVCMAKDRDQRYASTADLLEDLEQVSSGEPPLQARKMFDLSSLLSLDSHAQHDPQLVNITSKESVFTNALFWFAIIGWLLALVFVIIVAVIVG